MAGIVLLREMMQTRFMIQSLTGRFTDCLERCKANGDTVDLNGCRLGPDCANIMYRYYPTVDFCNSEDDYLDSVLKSNCEAARQTPEEYEELDLTGANDLDIFMTLVNSLPTGAKYNPKVSLSNVCNKAVLILLIMSRPDVEFDIRSCAADIFEFVRDLWVSSAEHHDEYWELIAPNITVRSVNENGLYGNQDYGFMKERDFIRARKVLPIEFGNSQIIKLDAGQRVSDEWYAVVEKCLNVFDTANQTKRIPGKTVKDFLTFREDG